MKTVREQLEEITTLGYGVSFDDVESRKDFIASITQIIKQRDEYVTNIDKLKYGEPLEEVKRRQEKTL